MSWSVVQGDCVELMKAMEPESFHAVVTDPPYGLEFMGKEWDKLGGTAGRDRRSAIDASAFEPFAGNGQPLPRTVRSSRRKCSACGLWSGGTPNMVCKCESPTWEPSGYGAAMQEWHRAWAVEALRVCKPGAHLIAFGGTRTYHRLACAIEDAGWEIRDSVYDLIALEPKVLAFLASLDDEQRGAFLEILNLMGFNGVLAWAYGSGFPKSHNGEWGGTALKPAYEPILLARKPLTGTVAENWAKHGCGGLDIDGSRIGYASDSDKGSATPQGKCTAKVGALAGKGQNGEDRTEFERPDQKGRWPSNVLLDQEAAAMLDGQSGELTTGAFPGVRNADKFRNAYGAFKGQKLEERRESNSGGASRFFYTSKAGQDERPEVGGVSHPTVKPLDLMRYLVGLVTREGDHVLEPFAGSGTTLQACVGLGRNCVACELNPAYIGLIERRMQTVTPSLFAEERTG